MSKIKECRICLYNDLINGVSFDSQGVCNYCNMIFDFKEKYKTGEEQGQLNFNKIIDNVKKSGKKKKYDCIVGVSGGTDSSFLVSKLVDWGLRPLAVHYDNTWNSSVATSNIKKVLSQLNIDLFTHVVNNKEIDDLVISFMKAKVPELEAPTDLALMEVIYRAAVKYKVKYIFEGHSFLTEGIAPSNSFYFDGKYIKSVHKKYGKVKLKTYPLMTLTRFLKYSIFFRIQRIRPFWYIDYEKEKAREFLTKKFGWEYYGGHHLENRLTAFNHLIYFKKFDINLKSLSLGADLRMGKITKKEAKIIYNKKDNTEEIMKYFLNRMNLNHQEFKELMSGENKTYRDYKTYKRFFVVARPLFFILMKANLVPDSFYKKYCFKAAI